MMSLFKLKKKGTLVLLDDIRHPLTYWRRLRPTERNQKSTRLQEPFWELSAYEITCIASKVCTAAVPPTAPQQLQYGQSQATGSPLPPQHQILVDRPLSIVCQGNPPAASESNKVTNCSVKRRAPPFIRSPHHTPVPPSPHHHLLAL